MELKDILALRLRALMDSRPDLDTQMKLRERIALSRDKFSQATIQRILSRQVHTGLDVLQDIAEAFGVPPTSLLEPITDSASVDKITPSIEEVALLHHWRKLDELEKHTVMGYLGLVGAAKTPRLSSNRKTTLDDDLPPDTMSAAHNRAAERPIPTKSKGEKTNVAPERGKRTKSSRSS